MSYEKVYATLNYGKIFSKGKLILLSICSIVFILCALVMDVVLIIATFVFKEYEVDMFILFFVFFNGLCGLGNFVSIFHIKRNKKIMKIFYLCI